jgi:Spy/CpxP family protein refolding chaperone
MKTRIAKTMTILGGAVLALALVATTADARGRGKMGDKDGRFEGRSGRLLATLDLSAEQQAALKAVKEERRETKQALHEQMMRAHEELRALAERDDATVEEVEAIEARLDDLHRQMRTERRAFRLEAYELLTPEQKAQVPTAWRLAIGPGPGMGPGKAWKGKGKGWHSRGFGPGPGMGPGSCRCFGQPPVASDGAAPGDQE